MDEISSKDGTPISKPSLENDRKLKKPRGKPKGLPKSGGRPPKVVELRDTSAWSDVLRANCFDIPTQAIKLFFDADTSNPLKFSILQFLAQYTTASIKPVEKADPDDSDTNTTANILAAVK